MVFLPSISPLCPLAILRRLMSKINLHLQRYSPIMTYIAPYPP